jgi:hypothetical protein
MIVIGLRLGNSNEVSRLLSGLSLACGPSEEGSDELMGNPSQARRLGFQHTLAAESRVLGAERRLRISSWVVRGSDERR